MKMIMEMFLLMYVFKLSFKNHLNMSYYESGVVFDKYSQSRYIHYNTWATLQKNLGGGHIGYKSNRLWEPGNDNKGVKGVKLKKKLMLRSLYHFVSNNSINYLYSIMNIWIKKKKIYLNTVWSDIAEIK